MKNILYTLSILFCGSAYAVSDNFGGISYLTDAANAWSQPFITPGPESRIRISLENEQNTDIASFVQNIRDIAYNDTAITIYTITQHTNLSDKIITSPLLTRRNTCAGNITNCPQTNRTLLIDGGILGTSANYNSNKNSDFKSHGRGAFISTRAFITNGFAFGIEYTHNKNKTHNTPVHTDSTTNSITMFTQYLSPNNIFINFGISGGQTSWNADKIVTNIGNENIYNTDFYNTIITMGMRMQYNRISITPQLFAKYMYMETGKHTDTLVQSYDKWWFNTLSSGGNLDFGVDFYNYNLIIRPTFNFGFTYDAINDGTSNINIKLANNAEYNIPSDTPNRFGTNGGIGISVNGILWSVTINYKFDYRRDYTDNTIYANIKMDF